MIKFNDSTEINTADGAVALSVERAASGHYVLRTPKGVAVGDIRKRGRTDWYCEVAIGGQFFNVCCDTLSEVLSELPYRSRKQRATSVDVHMIGNLRRRLGQP